jgi:hypothetical protein
MILVKQLDAFAEAACRILEEQVFMFGEFCDKTRLPPHSEPCFMASVDFEGPVVGTCFWVGSDVFCIELAANMLGVEPSDNLAVLGKEDALKELINVICCQFLTSVYGTAPLFQLGSPVSQHLNDKDWVRYINSQGTVGLVVEEEPVLLGLALQAH